MTSSTPPPPPPTPPQPPTPPPGTPPGQRPQNIPTYLWQSIVLTIVCCLPFGIPAIVYASRVNSLLIQGDPVGAMKASQNAKMWCWVAAGVGTVGGLIYGVLILFGVLSGI